MDENFYILLALKAVISHPFDTKESPRRGKKFPILACSYNSTTSINISIVYDCRTKKIR